MTNYQSSASSLFASAARVEKSPVPSRKEVDDLISQWIGDPCWDLGETEGFEAFANELREYQLVMEARWEKAYQDELLRYAEEIGIPGNLALVKHIRYLEQRIRQLEDK